MVEQQILNNNLNLAEVKNHQKDMINVVPTNLESSTHTFTDKTSEQDIEDNYNNVFLPTVTRPTNIELKPVNFVPLNTYTQAVQDKENPLQKTNSLLQATSVTNSGARLAEYTAGHMNNSDAVSPDNVGQSCSMNQSLFERNYLFAENSAVSPIDRQTPVQNANFQNIG